MEALLRHELAGEGAGEESLSNSPRGSEMVEEEDAQSRVVSSAQSRVGGSVSESKHPLRNECMDEAMNPSMHESIHESIHQSMNPSMNPSTHPSTHPSMHESPHPPSVDSSARKPFIPSVPDSLKDSLKDSQTNEITEHISITEKENNASMSLVEDSQENSQENSHGGMEEETTHTSNPSHDGIEPSSSPHTQNHDGNKENAMEIPLEDISPASEKCTEESRCERIPAGTECTVIQVDLDLDNPEVSRDCREAEIRFYDELTASMNAVQKEDFTPQLFKQIHELIANQKEPLSDAVMDMIGEIVDGLRASLDDTVIESADEESTDKKDMITLEPLTMDIRSNRRREVSTVSIMSEEKRIRLDECN